MKHLKNYYVEQIVVLTKFLFDEATVTNKQTYWRYTENTLGQQTYDLTVRTFCVSYNSVPSFGTQQPEIVVMNGTSATVQLV